MLARTHGQPASPTRLGKEMKVFTVRLVEQLQYFSTLKHATKFVGEMTESAVKKNPKRNISITVPALVVWVSEW